MHKPSARVLVFSTMLVGLIGLVWFLRSFKASQLQQTKTEIAAERREEPQQETADVVLTQQNDTNIPYDIHGSIAAAPIMISTGLAAVATPQADRSEADRTAELRQSSAFTMIPAGTPITSMTGKMNVNAQPIWRAQVSLNISRG